MSLIIIGAGPAGLTAGYALTKAGYKVVILEAAGRVGGMCQTMGLWDQKVDLGPHRFFSDDPRVTGLWAELVGKDYDIVDRLTRIYYKKRFFHYPLKPVEALIKLGFLEACRCFCSYLLAKTGLIKVDQKTFEGWVTSRFGRRLYQIFFKTYSEKLWGIPCTDLDADFAAQRIKKLSMLEVIKNALKLGGKQHKTLVDQFGYPHGGTGMLYTRMADHILENGGEIHLNKQAAKVLVKDQSVIGIQLADGSVVSADTVVSCLPFTDLVDGMDDLPANIKANAQKLHYRNTILVYLKIDGTDLFPDNWLYVHASELKTGRVSNFRNWTPHLYGHEKATILCLEYWCYDTDHIWGMGDDALISLASAEISKTGLIGTAPVAAGNVIKIRRSYPVYARGYRDLLAPIEESLDKISGLQVIGRAGAFKYNNQDHSILMGLLAAENISKQAGHNLWAINTDYEYQEAAKISETGI